jgi:hypothetical protein
VIFPHSGGGILFYYAWGKFCLTFTPVFREHRILSKNAALWLFAKTIESANSTESQNQIKPAYARWKNSKSGGLFALKGANHDESKPARAVCGTTSGRWTKSP